MQVETDEVFTDTDFTEKQTRRLATIRQIANIEPISGADMIELATVDGWQCVVSKNDGFKIGDWCVYFEIDSILPNDNPVFKFMEPRGYRVKTIKLRSQISQGLAMPLNLFFTGEKPLMGDDVTEILRVTKRMPNQAGSKALGGNAKGFFPSFIPKTDEERIQNCYNTVSPYFTHKWVVTEKLDGSSMTMFIKNEEFGVCSRNLELKYDDSNEGNAFVSYAMRRKMDKAFMLVSEGDTTPTNFAVQGELVGPGIQQNRYELQETKFFGFNVYDIDKSQYLDYSDARLIMGLLGIQPVDEVLYNLELQDMSIKFDTDLTATPPIMTVQDLVTLATRKSVLNNKVWMEGLVFRTMLETHVHRFGRLSFKVINPQFLLKEKD